MNASTWRTQSALSLIKIVICIYCCRTQTSISNEPYSERAEAVTVYDKTAVTYKRHHR
jgi:hypothetical protein